MINSFSIKMGCVGWAKIVDIDNSFQYKPGEGNLVTGTFQHEVGSAVDLYVEGQEEPIGVTETHPFWSVDREDFVPVGELVEGERLLLFNGETKRVTQRLPRPGPECVYNLEVLGEHVYLVTQDGLLVHNFCISYKSQINHNGQRPHFRTSETDLVSELQGLFGNNKVRGQLHIKPDGSEGGGLGCTIPDAFLEGKKYHYAFEIKNYNLITNYDGLVRFLLKGNQLQNRAKNLRNRAQNIRQVLVIDARGQNINHAQLMKQLKTLEKDLKLKYKGFAGIILLE